MDYAILGNHGGQRTDQESDSDNIQLRAISRDRSESRMKHPNDALWVLGAMPFFPRAEFRESGKFPVEGCRHAPKKMRRSDKVVGF